MALTFISWFPQRAGANIRPPRCRNRDGVALVGDAASSNDPSWGQGLALRDACVLSDEMLADQDWAAAGNRYAARHGRHYGTIRTVSGWFYDIFQRLGLEAEAWRARALPLIAQDPTRPPASLAKTRVAMPTAAEFAAEAAIAPNARGSSEPITRNSS